MKVEGWSHQLKWLACYLAFGAFVYCALSLLAFLYIFPFDMARELGGKVFSLEYIKPRNPVFLQWLIMAMVFKGTPLVLVFFSVVIIAAGVLLRKSRTWAAPFVVFVLLSVAFSALEWGCKVVFRPPGLIIVTEEKDHPSPAP